MKTSRIALAAAIALSGLSFGHVASATENRCSAEVYGNYNNVEVTCPTVDRDVIAREVRRQIHGEQARQRQKIVICNNGFEMRQIFNPGMEIDPWNRCFTYFGRIGWAEVRDLY